MTDEKRQEGQASGGQPKGRGEGDRRSGRERGDRRGRGRRRRRGPAKEQPADGRQQTQPKQPREEQPPAGSLVAFLARAGVGSRRRCDEMVRAGLVTVNDQAVDFPRQKLGPEDVVAVDGEVVAQRPLRYVLLNKPRGVASTRSDPHAERVIVDLVPDGRVLFPVGRLDVDTTGLIVLTNDGPLAHRLMHPSYGVPKTYVARVRGRVGRQEIAALRNGIELEDGMTAPAEARVLKQSGKSTLVELTIHQGRKRQVRRMFAALGLTVDELQRRRYGPLADNNLAAGKWRDLSSDEVDALRRAAEHVDTCVDSEPEEYPVNLAADEQQAAPATVEDRAPSPAGSDSSELLVSADDATAKAATAIGTKDAAAAATATDTEDAAAAVETDDAANAVEGEDAATPAADEDVATDVDASGGGATPEEAPEGSAAADRGPDEAAGFGAAEPPAPGEE